MKNTRLLSVICMVSCILITSTIAHAVNVSYDFAGVSKPVFDITGGQIIRIQGGKNQVDMPTSAIEVTATAIDDSGNKQLEQAVLPIND